MKRLLFALLLVGLPAPAAPAPAAAPLSVTYGGVGKHLGTFLSREGTVFTVVRLRLQSGEKRLDFGPRRFSLTVNSKSYPISEATYLLEDSCEEYGFLRAGAAVRCGLVFEVVPPVKAGRLILSTRAQAEPGKPLTVSAPLTVSERW